MNKNYNTVCTHTVRKTRLCSRSTGVKTGRNHGGVIKKYFYIIRRNFHARARARVCVCVYMRVRACVRMCIFYWPRYRILILVTKYKKRLCLPKSAFPIILYFNGIKFFATDLLLQNAVSVFFLKNDLWKEQILKKGWIIWAKLKRWWDE